MIRADLLDADGVNVIARAVVPFEREEGQSIAAVAPGQPPAAETPPEQPTQNLPPFVEQPPADASGDQGEPAMPPRGRTDAARRRLC